jgi:hypothetical protein
MTDFVRFSGAAFSKVSDSVKPIAGFCKFLFNAFAKQKQACFPVFLFSKRKHLTFRRQ